MVLETESGSSGKEKSGENGSEVKSSPDSKSKSSRTDYLMEKYGHRWRQQMWKVPAVTLKLTQTTWLQVSGNIFKFM